MLEIDYFPLQNESAIFLGILQICQWHLLFHLVEKSCLYSQESSQECGQICICQGSEDSYKQNKTKENKAKHHNYVIIVSMITFLFVTCIKDKTLEMVARKFLLFVY